MYFIFYLSILVEILCVLMTLTLYGHSMNLVFNRNVISILYIVIGDSMCGVVFKAVA